MVTSEMKAILKQIADLCYKASEEIVDNEETKEILNLCDKLQDSIDQYLKIGDYC